MASERPASLDGAGSAAGPSSNTAAASSSRHQHQPKQSSGLRHSEMPPESPEDKASSPAGEGSSSGSSSTNTQSRSTDGARQQKQEGRQPDDERTGLLRKATGLEECDSDCDHGSFSPRPQMGPGYGSFADTNYTGKAEGTAGYGGIYPEGDQEPASDHHESLIARGETFVEGMLGDAITDGLLGRPKRHGTTHWLASAAGLKHERMMYLQYYFPFLKWIKQYRWDFLQGDLVAALTMASFYIPMALSYASNLGHMPPINGLYSFALNPFMYALLGTCPQMVVGPEAAGSLLTGSVVTEAIKAGHFKDSDGMRAAEVGGMVTGLAGAIILAAGICRLGFLDSVLSRPFLRGFISSIGLVIFIDQLIPEMGLDDIAEKTGGSHGSPLDKLLFVIQHGYRAHKLTCAVSFGCLGITLILRELKRRLSPLRKLEWVVYIPDRFVIVVLSAVLAWTLDWEPKGVDILGDIKVPKGQVPFQPHFPFAESNFKHVNDAFATSFIVALLGFFESCVAAKSLGTGTGKTERKTKTKSDGSTEEVHESEGIRGMTVSSNRELVALGIANLIGGFFMALPAFGGYGRSKVNKSTGGKTPMSSIFLSLITVICIFFLLPYFYYIPKGVLSAMITVVSISLLEEAPHDILFFWRIGGYIELFLMALIFLTTFFWSLRGGIMVGLGFSLIRLLRHSTRPRIQILGRIPGSREFDNAEVLALEGHVEMVPHCLIVKIPEPLTFANTGSLKDRLRRLEDHGTNYAHPALPSVRDREQNKNVIFDIHGVTEMDFAASQVLLEIVADYIERGTMVFFCRVPSRRSRVWTLFLRAGIVELCGGEKNFLPSVEEALRATEKAITFREYANRRESAAPSATPGFTPDEGGPPSNISPEIRARVGSRTAINEIDEV